MCGQKTTANPHIKKTESYQHTVWHRIACQAYSKDTRLLRALCCLSPTVCLCLSKIGLNNAGIERLPLAQHGSSITAAHAKTQFALPRGIREFILESNMNDHGQGTQIQVVPDSMIQCSDSLVVFL